MPYVDLHLHTNHSDGSDAPARVAARAAELGIAAIAITDHDTVSGLAEGRRAAVAAGIAFLDGTEISTHFDGCDVHVLGLGIDPENAALCDALKRLEVERVARAERIGAALREAGIALDVEKVRARAGEGVVGRLHIAKELCDMGVVREPQEAFDRFLSPGRPAFVRKSIVSAEDAVALIHGARGLAFVAHPGLSKTTRKLLPRLLGLPFDGLEAYHINHSPGRTAEYVELAESRGLLVSGGSDCHGTIKGETEMGKVRTPYERYERITSALAERSRGGPRR